MKKVLSVSTTKNSYKGFQILWRLRTLGGAYSFVVSGLKSSNHQKVAWAIDKGVFGRINSDRYVDLLKQCIRLDDSASISLLTDAMNTKLYHTMETCLFDIIYSSLKEAIRQSAHKSVDVLFKLDHRYLSHIKLYCEKYRVCSYDEYKTSPLAIAIQNRDAPMIDRLIEHKFPLSLHSFRQIIELGISNSNKKRLAKSLIKLITTPSDYHYWERSFFLHKLLLKNNIYQLKMPIKLGIKLEKLGRSYSNPQQG